MPEGQGVETRIEGPWIAPLSSVGMSEMEFTERLMDHVEGRRRWPVVVSLAIDIVVTPTPGG